MQHTRRALLLVPVAAVAFTMAGPAPASGHATGPCDDSGGVGHSDYGIHHISAMAKQGMIGGDGHVPGSHQGYSLCLGVHD